MSETLYTGMVDVRILGPWFVGGHTPPIAGLDAATATTRRGAEERPILPASALKGALREAVARRLRSEGKETWCEPWTPWEERSDGCAKTPCRVCRIFGAPGPDRPGVQELVKAGTSPIGGGWGKGGLRIGDALPQDDVSIPMGDRYGVSIDRVTGRAAEQRLFQRRVADPDGAVVLCAPFRARLSQEDWEYLKGAARLLNRIGNSRTRGLGEVEVELRHAPLESVPGVACRGRLAARALVKVTAIEPLHLGAPPRPDSTRATLDFIPGSALHGALYAAAARAGSGAGISQDEAARLGSTLSLSDLYAINADDQLPCPPHRALLACRSCGKHVDRSVAEAVDTELLRRKIEGDAAGAWPTMSSSTCPVCDKDGLKPAVRFVHGGHVRRRLITRLATDPATQSAAPGMLHAREQIEPGTRFLGSVNNLDDALVDMLERLGDSGEPVLVGGLRTRGLGTVRVEVRPWADDLDERIRRYQKAARDEHGPRLTALGWASERLLLVVARTPIALRELELSAQVVGRALFGTGAYEVRHVWQRLDTRSGWNDREGAPREVRPVVRAGSCWLFEASGDLDMARLSDAETIGVGEDRALGLGRLYHCPSLPSR